MNLTGLGLSPALSLAAALAAGLAILYLLKLRRRRITVPFSPLWARVLMDKDATNWLQRLKRLFSLLLWVFIMALLVAALTDPQPEAELERGRNIALVLDTSASMSAREAALGNRTRFQLAVEKANALIGELGPHDRMMIIAVDGQVRSVTGDFTDNGATLREALENLTPSATEAQVVDGLRTAVDTLTGRREPHIIFISDGAHPELMREVPAEAALVTDDPDATSPEGTAAPADAAAGAPGDAVSPDDAPQLEPPPGPERVFALPDKLLRDEITFEHVVVGESKGNIAVTGFNIRRYLSNKLDYEVYVQVRNYFDRPVFAELTLYNLIPDPKADGGYFYKDIEKRTLELGPGSRELRFYKNLPLASDHLAVRVKLATKGLADALAMDNDAFVLVPRFRQARILLVSPGNLFLEAALLLNENFEVEVVHPDDPFLHPGGSVDLNLAGLRDKPYDVVIFDNSLWDPGEAAVAPAPTVTGNYLYINPKGEASPFATADVKDPLIERIDRKHPVARWLVLKDLNVLRGSRIRTTAGDRVIVRAVDGPLVVARRDGGSNLLAIGFSVIESDIVFRVALPVLLINAVDWFLDESNSLIQGYHTGKNWHVPVPVGVTAVDIKDPAGKLDVGVPTHEGKVVYYGARTGFYALSPSADVPRPSGVPAQWEVAANFSSARESDIEPARAPLPRREGVTAQRAERNELDPRLQRWAWIFDLLTYDLWIYCVFAVLGLLVLEWFTYHRRWTV